mmetsp:Transcript_345/g.986  ORF Transcript_345/g.986 Transcript_345/m.986 type:complete len:254 (-) Transcript_345:174-935(-)
MRCVPRPGEDATGALVPPPYARVAILSKLLSLPLFTRTGVEGTDDIAPTVAGVGFQFEGNGVPNARCPNTCGAAALQGNALAGFAFSRRGRTTSAVLFNNPGLDLNCSGDTKCLSKSSTLPPHTLNSNMGKIAIPTACSTSIAPLTSSAVGLSTPRSISSVTSPLSARLGDLGGVSRRSVLNASTAPASSASSSFPISSSSSSSSKSSIPSAKYASPFDPKRIVKSVSVPFTVTVTTLAAGTRKKLCAFPNRT